MSSVSELTARFDQWFKENRNKLDEPYIYQGDEINSVQTKWEVTEPGEGPLKFVFCSGTGYGMSRGMNILYDLFHRSHPEWIVERAAIPMTARDRRRLKEAGFPIMSSESHRPFKAYDIVGFSCNYPAADINIIAALLMSGIAPTWQERKESDPLIIHGGLANINLSVIKDVCDMYFIGEGEDRMPDLLAEIEVYLRSGMSREQLLLSIAQNWDCVWVPRFYEERWDENGRLLGMFPTRPDVPAKVRRTYVKDLDNCFIMTKPILNYNSRQASTGECSIEISRGCDGKCGFCNAGFNYLPYRPRSMNTYFSAVKEWEYNNGCMQVMPMAFSFTAHPEYYQILHGLLEEGFRATQCSMRISDYISRPDGILALHNRRMAFGVEGNSERLRKLVSKHVSSEDLLKVVSLAMDRSFKEMKFYMIAELPGETREDTLEILELGKRIRELIDRKVKEGYSPISIRFSWNLLSIIPGTPFQWSKVPLEISDNLKEAISGLRELEFLTNTPELINNDAETRINNLLCRGDSRLQKLMIRIAKEDALSFYYSFSDKAVDIANDFFAKENVPGWDWWFREIGLDEVLNWDFIDNGASKEYLMKRYQQAMSTDPKVSPYCMENCDGCGTCDSEQRTKYRAWNNVRAKDRETSPGRINNDRKCNGHPYYFLFSINEPYNTADVYGWNLELARALTRSGIAYDKNNLGINPYVFYHDDRSAGIYEISAVIHEPIDSPEDMADIVRRINHETVHFQIERIVDAEDNPIEAVIYRYSFDEDRRPDIERAVEGVNNKKANGETWEIPVRYLYNDINIPTIKRQNVLPNIDQIWIEGKELWMRLRKDINCGSAPARAILCALLGQDVNEYEEGLMYREDFVFSRDLELFNLDSVK